MCQSARFIRVAAGKLGVRTRFALGKLISFDDKKEKREEVTCSYSGLSSIHCLIT